MKRRVERPEWFPQKFWDDDGPNLEKMAGSYVNMEKQFHKRKHKAPEDGKYNFDFIQDTIGMMIQFLILSVNELKVAFLNRHLRK